MVVVEGREDEREEMGGREEMDLVWVCFTFRLNWFGTNNKLRTHGPRSPTLRGNPWLYRFISLLYSLKKSLLIATLKAWYKYRAMKKQQPLARPK